MGARGMGPRERAAEALGVADAWEDAEDMEGMATDGKGLVEGDKGVCVGVVGGEANEEDEDEEEGGGEVSGPEGEGEGEGEGVPS